MHKIASIFGYGKGANKNKEFTYTVGVKGLNTLPTWKTGTNGIPASAARPLNIEDVKQKLGITETTLSNISQTINYGQSESREILKLSIFGINESGGRKSYTFTNEGFKLNKTDISDDKKNYKDIVFNNTNYLLGSRNITLLKSPSIKFGAYSVNKNNDIISDENSYAEVYTYTVTKAVPDNPANPGSGSSSVPGGDTSGSTGGHGGTSPGWETHITETHTDMKETEINEIPMRVLVTLSANNPYSKVSNIAEQNVWNIEEDKKPITEPQIGDIVYYNHKISEDNKNKDKQTVTIEKGSASTPGYGGKDTTTEPQTFSADKYNTTWRVWDKLPDGRVMLVSNKTVARLNTGHGVGHIWWEHNAHKISSIFGYGYGADTTATNNFPYKVGSGIDDAPDMTEGDKGNWKIGQNGINVSGARSLTLPEVEEKLEITEDKIKNKTNDISINSSNTYGKQLTTSMSSVVQRDIGSSNQTWEDKTKAKAKNKSYKMTDRYYYWDKDKITEQNIPNIKYKEMLFNQIDNRCGLATNALDVYNGGGNVSFKRGYVSSSSLGSNIFRFVNSNGSSWYEDEYGPSFRVAVYLKSKTKYIKALGEDGAWDLGDVVDTKQIKVNMKNSGSKDVKVKTKVKAVSNVDLGEINEYTSDSISNSQSSNTYEAKVKNGQKRTGSGDYASFTMYENKYNINIGIENLPLGHAYKVTGSKQGEIDVKDNLEYNVEIWDKYNLTLKDIIVRKDGKVDINDGISNLPNDSSITLKNKDEIIKTNEIGEKEYEVIVKIGEDVYNEKIIVRVIDNVQISVKYINEMLKNVITDIEPYIINEKVEIKTTLNNQYYGCKIVENGKYNIKFKVGENLENVPNGYRNEGEYTIEYIGNPMTEEYIVVKKDGKEIIGSKKYLYKASKKEMGDEVKYDIHLKPVLKLPFTGKEISLKTGIYVLGTSLLLGILVRVRRKIFVIFKKYNIMK